VRLFKHQTTTIVGAHIVGWSVRKPTVQVNGKPDFVTDVWMAGDDSEVFLKLDGDHAAALERAVTGKAPAKRKAA
jgi:hypothetical protein